MYEHSFTKLASLARRFIAKTSIKNNKSAGKPNYSKHKGGIPDKKGEGDT